MTVQDDGDAADHGIADTVPLEPVEDIAIRLRSFTLHLSSTSQQPNRRLADVVGQHNSGGTEQHDQRVDFHVAKAQFYQRLHSKMNGRQEKVIARMFREGIDGFRGGLSAENYIAISPTSRATATRDLQDLVEKGALYEDWRTTAYTVPPQAWVVHSCAAEGVADGKINPRSP
jgi:hypothetical protein